MQSPTDRLVAEALAKSGLLWVSSPAWSSPVWHVVVDAGIYIVGGPVEQFCPPHDGRTRVVTRVKESRAPLASFEADVSRMGPQDNAWERATEALRTARLNAPEKGVIARWRESGVVLRLRPDLTTVVVRGELLPPPHESEAPDDVVTDKSPGATSGGAMTEAASGASADGLPLDHPELAAGGRPQAERAAQRVAEDEARDDAGNEPHDRKQDQTGPAPSGPPASPLLGSGDDGSATKVSP